jgi:hypothetical protein
MFGRQGVFTGGPLPTKEHRQDTKERDRVQEKHGSHTCYRHHYPPQGWTNSTSDVESYAIERYCCLEIGAWD